MIFHVLPGDALAETFAAAEIDGETIVCRECLIDGPVASPDIESFWGVRSRFIREHHGASDYDKSVASEMQKLLTLEKGDEVNLWFEYELFCSTNYWFCLRLLRNVPAAVYRVAPVVLSEAERWSGFGKMDAGDLRECLRQRRELSTTDRDRGAALWDAYASDDAAKLLELSSGDPDAFPYLAEVAQAAVDKHSRPIDSLRKIRSEGVEDLAAIFARFSAENGVYGYGDAQVRRLLTEDGLL